MNRKGFLKINTLPCFVLHVQGGLLECKVI